MKHFVNLSSRVINKFHIIEIIKKSTRYDIYMNNADIDFFCLVGSGGATSRPHVIEVCKYKNKKDYNIITDLINSD
jgi:hypothetical protein